MDLTAYQSTPQEQKRIADLMDLVPRKGGSALDIGTRYGYLAIALTEFFDFVTALDLEKPNIKHEKVVSVEGDVTSLNFPDQSFDFVLCTEVLEHIPPHLLRQACAETARVARNHVIIGVPYKQDIRVGRTTCYTCGKKNPPWGHVNVFDEIRLKQLFPELTIEKVSFVGKTKVATNFIATFLLDLAGNPYGTYSQEESCIYCGAKLKQPPQRSFLQKVYTRFAFYLNDIQKLFVSAHPNWIHILFRKE